jgi:hypothetical protein
VAGGQGENGQNGQNGGKGETGATGPAGAQYVGANWGTVDRNTIGSPDIALRAGPIVAPGTGTTAPPFGSGSLGFLVANPSGATEKAVFGNQVDFAGKPLSGLNQVGFRVFQTGENSSSGVNMPNITFEVDKNGGTLQAGDYSTFVFVPAANSPSDQWSPYIDATNPAAGDWYYTGGVGTSTGCNQSTMCEFPAAKATLPSATILTAQLQKGRDNAWQGAIDGFRINNEVFDFEQFGVVVRAP